MSITRTLASFVVSAQPPREALERAGRAYLDTIGVTLAGSAEPPARLVQALVADESPAGPARILGTAQRAGAGGAALANGTAAHALDFDDTAFLLLGHPSAPMVAAALAVGDLNERDRASASRRVLRRVRDRRGVGPRHEPGALPPGLALHVNHRIGGRGRRGRAPAGARRRRHRALSGDRRLARVGAEGEFRHDVEAAARGLAARNGVQAALLAARGFTASENAFDGPQGFLFAFDAERSDAGSLVGQLGQRWEIVESGFSVKLYPSCAATHPTLDALLDLRRRVGFGPADVESIDVGVDAMTPTVLQYDRPRTGLEGKFSLHYCAAAAIVHGSVTLETFDDARINDPGGAGAPAAHHDARRAVPGSGRAAADAGGAHRPPARRAGVQQARGRRARVSGSARPRPSSSRPSSAAAPSGSSRQPRSIARSIFFASSSGSPAFNR